MATKDTNNKTKMPTYEDIAKFFLAFGNETGEPVTNLKLQKLVYYAQAWYLANYGKPLFDADFQAWVHGPVIPDLYQTYKSFGFAPILSDIKLDDVKLDAELKEFLNEVAQVYMPYGGYQLEMMTHKEDPWVEARAGCEPDQRCENVISKDAMKKFYGEKAKDKTN